MSNDAASLSASSGVPQRFGPYYLQELINTGGLAEIWVATASDGRTFAVRRLLEKFQSGFSNRAARQRFDTGCEVHKAVHHHELIIGYHDHGKIDGAPYCLMEFVESSNLKLLLARQDPVLGEFVGNILIDMAIALDHMHDCGYMHLDFKPENVLVSRNGNVKLCDFDLSQPKPDKPKKAPGISGTPLYMAPEQLRQDPFDHRADIFAFGVSAYEVLTGEKPFPGESPEDIQSAHMSGLMDPIRELNADVPPKLEAIIHKCLAVEPDDRYPYMSVVVRDLQAELYVDSQ
jgi:serine/threonine-protein kinase